MILTISGKKLRIKDCRYSSGIGLMFSNMKDIDGALIHGNSIWMLFVKKELDLFFLDENLRVVETMKAIPLTLKPGTWKLYDCKKAKYCLEVKSGLVKLRKGMKIRI